jgi:hypothetical protein
VGLYLHRFDDLFTLRVSAMPAISALTSEQRIRYGQIKDDTICFPVKVLSVTIDGAEINSLVWTVDLSKAVLTGILCAAGQPPLQITEESMLYCSIGYDDVCMYIYIDGKKRCLQLMGSSGPDFTLRQAEINHTVVVVSEYCS